MANLPDAPCAPARPLAAVFFHGTDDENVPYRGGGTGPDGSRGRVRSADDTVQTFADAAACATRKRRLPMLGAAWADASSVVYEDRGGCRAPIVRGIVERGGHGWPGRKTDLPTSMKVDATAVIVGLFLDSAAP
jgi:polyhydroxybutyrate depolymerase